MKKQLILLVFLFTLIPTIPAFAQIDDEELEEIYIDKMSRAQIEQVIIKVRNQTFKNYVEGTEVYNISHHAVLGDTLELISSKEDFDISIFFKTKKLNKTVKPHAKNLYKINEEFFGRYSFNDSPMYWLTEFVIRKYVNVPDLDFLHNFPEYDFHRTVKDGITRIDFFSDNIYEGYFTFDKYYNLHKVVFELIKPYPIDHSQTRNGKKMFDKNWLYTKEKVSISFGLNAQKNLYIKEMTAEEVIENYNFSRYNSKRELLIEDKNLKFNSELIFIKK